MTPLARILAQQIALQGPMTVADYMAQCLLHPQHGYYTTLQAIGAAGDFITAPEISQMFGEMLGLCLAQSWLDQGAPAPFALCELGPGRGTLMADILRATRGVSGFHAAMDLHLVEASDRLRAEQAERLTGQQPNWHDSLQTVPDLPLFLVANEFFDALPIRQFQRGAQGWSERVIGVNDGALSMGLTPEGPIPALDHRLADTTPGDLVETCAPGRQIADEIAQRIASAGGCAVIVDYGDWRSLGDTWQALRDHAPVDPLTCAGTADLTAHVDFEALLTAQPCPHTKLTPQGVFLERLGITARAQALAKTLGGAALNAHVAAHRRLTHPQEMGTLFKVAALYPTSAAPPPGLEPICPQP